jgi:SAM-dependent methyltransferase
MNQLPRIDNATVLDVGCLDGRYTHALSRRYDQTVGIDLSMRNVSIARKRYPGSVFIFGDGYKPHEYFFSDSIDFAVMMNTITWAIALHIDEDHLPWLRTMFDNLRKVLKPHSYILVSMMKQPFVFELNNGIANLLYPDYLWGRVFGQIGEAIGVQK